MADTAQKLTIKYLPLDQVLGAPRNPNEHDIPGIKDSMRRHGFVEPLIHDERTGYLLGGHGRIEALGEMRTDGEPAPARIGRAWSVPVVHGVRSENDAEAEALLLAMLRLPKQQVTDLATLTAMLDEVAQSTDGGLVGTGYTADDLDDMLAELQAGLLPDQGTDAEHAPLPDRAPPGTPREQQGLHEVGLMFQALHHAEYMEHLAKLKRAWNEEAAPMVVLRALREAAAAAG